MFSLFVTNLTCIPILSLSSLRPLDVEFMKALHEKVNIVPVLAKADTLTPTEVKKKKIKVDCNNKPATWLLLQLLHLRINLFLCLLFLCRSAKKLSNTASRYINFPTVTLMKMKTLSSKTVSWRWEPEPSLLFTTPQWAKHLSCRHIIDE